LEFYSACEESQSNILPFVLSRLEEIHRKAPCAISYLLANPFESSLATFFRGESGPFDVKEASQQIPFRLKSRLLPGFCELPQSLFVFPQNGAKS
jgi:hypothetical protein